MSKMKEFLNLTYLINLADQTDQAILADLADVADLVGLTHLTDLADLSGLVDLAVLDIPFDSDFRTRGYTFGPLGIEFVLRESDFGPL